MEGLNLLHPITNLQKSNCKHMQESYSVSLLKNKNSMSTMNTTNIANQLLEIKTKYTNLYTKNLVIIIFIRINHSQIIIYTNEWTPNQLYLTWIYLKRILGQL
jgi:hypothetical protein